VETVLVDCIGRRRSPATLPGYHVGRPPRNKGLRYPRIRRRWRRSSGSCAPPAMGRSLTGCEA
jgi:hypothetical protein